MGAARWVPKVTRPGGRAARGRGTRSNTSAPMFNNRSTTSYWPAAEKSINGVIPNGGDE